MSEKNIQICVSCGTSIELPPLPGVFEQFSIKMNDFFYNDTDVFFVVCPKCGFKQSISKKIFFFGTLTGTQVWKVLRLFPLFVICVGLYTLFSK